MHIHIYSVCFISYGNTFVSSVIMGIRSGNIQDGWRIEDALKHRIRLTYVTYTTPEAMERPIFSEKNIREQKRTKIRNQRIEFIIDQYFSWKKMSCEKSKIVTLFMETTLFLPL